MGCHMVSLRKTFRFVSTNVGIRSGWKSVTSRLHLATHLVFTNLAWDNTDRLEETFSGKGPCHCVNGIAVQPRVLGTYPPPKDLPRIDKRKQGTLSKEHQLQFDVYVTGPRMGPQPFKTKDDYAVEANKAARNAEQKNLLWILARQVNSRPRPRTRPKGFLVGPDLTSKQGSSLSNTRA